MYFRTAFIFIYVTVFSFATHHFSLFVHPFVQSFCLVYVAGSRIFPSCGSETRKLKSLLIGAPVPRQRSIYSHELPRAVATRLGPTNIN